MFNSVRFGNQPPNPVGEIQKARDTIKQAHEIMQDVFLPLVQNTRRDNWNGRKALAEIAQTAATVEKAYISEFEFAPPSSPALKFGEQLKKMIRPFFGNMYSPRNPYGSPEALQMEKERASTNIAWAHEKLKELKDNYANWGESSRQKAAGLGALALGEKAFIDHFDFTA